MAETGDIRIDDITPQVPDRWVMLPLEDCLDQSKKEFRKLKKKDIKSNGIYPVIDQGEDFISGYVDREIDLYRGPLPVIIFGDHTRRIKFVDFQFAVGADGTKIFHPFPALQPKFFYYYLRSLNLASQGYSRHYRFLKLIDVPVPSLNEQHQIVAKLEKLLAKVEACQERLNKIPLLLKRFRQSVLAAACSGRLTADWRKQNSNVEPAEQLGNGDPPSDFDLPSTWNWLFSVHAFGFVTSGSRGWARFYSNEGALFIRVGNLNHDSIKLDLKSIQRVSPPVSAEGRRTKVIEGDILISITADVGMVALVEAGLEEAYINQHIALGRPVGNMDQRYLAYFLTAKNGGQKQFLNLQRGATKVGLGLDDIRSIWISRPPLPEQQEIVRRVKDLFKIADRIEDRYKKAKAHIDRLTQSILAKAFRGELVPQNARDEPMSDLLKRIQEKKERNKEKGGNVKK